MPRLADRQPGEQRCAFLWIWLWQWVCSMRPKCLTWLVFKSLGRLESSRNAAPSTPTKPQFLPDEWRVVWALCQGVHSQRWIGWDMFISEAYANFVLFPGLWSTVVVHINLWKDLERLSSDSISDVLRLLSVPCFSSWSLNLKELGDACWERFLHCSAQSLPYSAVTVNSTQRL